MLKNMTVIALTVVAGCHGSSLTPGEFSRGKIKTADGVSITYDVRGEGSVALVFVHGWACDRSFWRGQADVFAGAYRVVTLDLPGHGTSGTDRKVWTVAGLGEDVARVVKRLGLKRVVLVGHSMGGPVALAAAERLRGRMLGVVCADAMHNADFKWPPGVAERWLSGFESDFDGAIENMVRAMFPEGADDSLVQWVIDRGRATDREAAIALMRDFTNLDYPKLLSDAGVPIRAINVAPGSKGGIPTKIEVNRKYADFAAVLMEDVGHYLMLERPAEFNSHLQTVLVELTGN